MCETRIHFIFVNKMIYEKSDSVYKTQKVEKREGGTLLFFTVLELYFLFVCCTVIYCEKTEDNEASNQFSRLSRRL